MLFLAAPGFRMFTKILMQIHFCFLVHYAAHLDQAISHSVDFLFFIYSASVMLESHSIFPPAEEC